VKYIYFRQKILKCDIDPRTSGRELSLILLFGTFLSFMATFVIVSKPGIAVCTITRFAVGFCYTGETGQRPVLQSM
jgi:hypothetical protein